MLKQSLNGVWELFQAGHERAVPACVPGCVHLDLMAAGVIEDPYYRDNELAALWIAETGWTYRRTFEVDAALLAHDQVLLRCDGLDTLATLTLNEQQIATTDNMFRVWEFDVKPYLKVGENQLGVTFEAALPYVKHKEATVNPLFAWGLGQYKANGGGWIRKQPSNFGWDWGPQVVTCGIWRDITLIGINDARLDDVNILQNHAPDGGVSLDFQLKAERFSSVGLTAEAQVVFKGQTIAEVAAALSEAEATIALEIPDPYLWWPHGMGDQPLYEVAVMLKTLDGVVLDIVTKRIGLRTLGLSRNDDQWGESFQFAVNGVPFFAKGANWIPADAFVTRLTENDYRRLLEAAIQVNMNMLRVWGGGIYEPDVFYDICDELGICVWQDFMFACTTYPTRDSDFMTTVKAEAEDAVRRIRHHASLALWCGNNELEQGLVANQASATTMNWADYGLLFDDLLKQVVVELSPQTDYWPASPHTPRGDRNEWHSPESGDCHVWTIWHAREPFEAYRNSRHRFISEFGFQSFPEPHTVEAYTQPEDRNITSFVMEHHQRHPTGNSTIVHYMTDWFRLPTSFDMMLWLSQILQGVGIKYAVEHWRRNMPRTMGTLYWQINDCWPVASWSSIDYFGRWKALHYMARRFYAPILISGVENIETGTVDIYVTSDLDGSQPGQIEWSLTDLEGNVLTSGSYAVTVSAKSSQCIDTLELGAELSKVGNRNALLWLTLSLDDEVISSNMITFAKPKYINFCDPGFVTTVRQVEGDFVITLTVEHPALYVWLSLTEADANFSDNFVHIRPGKLVEIKMSGIPKHMTLEEVRQQLIVRSLTDTYA